MGTCLTPMPWSSHPERREAPLRTDAMDIQAGTLSQLRERAAIWESWLRDFGGRTFVEPEVQREYVLVVRRETRRDAILVLADRWEAFDLRDAMRRHGHDVEIEVRRPRARGAR